MPASKSATSVRPATEHDGRVPGLQLRHFPTRSIWYLYYRTRSGRERRPKIGDARIISRAKAREIALGMLAEVAAGRDPADQPRNEPTLSDLWARIQRDALPAMKPRSQREVADLWRLHILPHLGERTRLADLEADDVERMHRAMATTPTRANRAVAVLHRGLALAVRWNLVGRNVATVERYTEPPRQRVPRPDEVARLLAALDRMRAQEPAFCGLVELLMLTGCRLREIMHARREWVRGHRLELPDSKTGAKVILLNSHARAVIAGLPVLLGNPYLIPGRRPRQPLQSPKGLWTRLLKEAGVTGLRIHDLRRLYASLGLSAGYTLDTVGQLLGHSQAQTTRRYAFLVTEAAERAAEAVGAELDRLRG